MNSDDSKTLNPSSPATTSSSSSTAYWVDRVVIPTVATGIGGGLICRGLVPAGKFAATAASYFGAREFLTFVRGSEVEDLSNSFMAGLGTGAWLCRLKGFGFGGHHSPRTGGRLGAALFATCFAIFTTTADFTAMKAAQITNDISKR
uniref:Uncharacterized protein n=1 Tax=Kalanchoe fedtschenkoi TaxID=63787 RepID=A0A7N0UWK2_KALFE